MKLTPAGLWWLAGFPLLLWILGRRDGGDGVTPAITALGSSIGVMFMIHMCQVAGSEHRPVLQVLVVCIGVGWFGAAGWLLWGVL